MQYKKVQKSSWNEPYSSSSFTKQSCSKMALYCWIWTESRWNQKLISLSSPNWSASLRPSFERKTRPDALIEPNDSTATGWKMLWAWMFEYFAVLRVAASSAAEPAYCYYYYYNYKNDCLSRRPYSYTCFQHCPVASVWNAPWFFGL